MRRTFLRTVPLIGFMILLSLPWLGIPGPVATAQDNQIVIQSVLTTEAPAIDGRFQPGEWDLAAFEPFTFFMVSFISGQETRFIPADLYLMNDHKNLYLGLQLFGVPYNNPGLAGDGFDAVFLLFDSDNDGVVEAGEDQKLLLTSQPNIDFAQRGSYVDNHVQVSDDDNGADLHIDGLGRIVHSNVEGVGDYTVEFVIPLNSGDPFDLRAPPGGQVRFNLLLATQVSAAIEAGGLFGVEFQDARGWGVIQLQTGAIPPDPEPLIGTISLVTNELGDGRQIYSMEADGSSLRRRTQGDQIVGTPFLSPDGEQIVYTAAQPDQPETQEIYVIGTNGGRARRLTNNNVPDEHPVISPNGQEIAFVRQGNVWLMRSSGGNERRLTGLGADSDPVWTTDGRIVFTTARWDGLSQVAVMSADGSNILQLTRGEKDSLAPRASPDGQWVTFFRYDGPGRLFDDFNVSLYYPWNIHRVRIDGTQEELLMSDGHLNLFPAFSPDGRGILYLKILSVATFYTGLYYLDLETGQERRVLENLLSRVLDPIDWR